MGGVNENPQLGDRTPEQDERFRELLAAAIAVVEGEGIPYVVAGSLASSTWGRPSTIGDIDLVVSPTDAKRLLKAFDSAGYETEEAQPQWLFKAKRDDVTVDIIFEMEGVMYLDDRMVERGSIRDVEGTRLRLMPAEDFVITQALSTREDTPDYWFNALGVLARTDLDWDYFVDRASRGPRRVLSLLLFAESADLPIPESAVRRLFESVYGR
jgi:hypothetical protein